MVDETLQRTGAGTLSSSAAEVEAVLERAVLQGPAAGRPSQRRDVEIAQYTREHQARILARHLDELIATSG